jgi:rhamnose utilization protein RhaD (predicted bifunctional aldolase and dehydrogenase)/NAD(P)-dependent dehydrogenase (short-subunit alcohol dehydrogenase family)
MKSLWNEAQAVKYQSDPLTLRVYTSRLLGQDSTLVLHGGGNTSVKIDATNRFGETEALLYVKGSGWDLATIETAGFAPVKLAVLQKMAQLEQLTDAEMVKLQRAAMTEPNAPNPSVEAILHAIIPFKYVDHTHADAVITITNTDAGAERIQQLYGNRVLIVPYVMPGFILAKKIAELTQAINWSTLEGMILLNHGVFSFADDAKTSYERMIQLTAKAEHYLKTQGATVVISTAEVKEDLLQLASIRKKVCEIKGTAMVTQLDTTPAAISFANLPNVTTIATRGPLTPDHVIRTKPKPVILGNQPLEDLEQYVQAYQDYFARNTNEHLIALNPAPCWAVWPRFGLLSWGTSVAEAAIISDIKDHTIQAIQLAEQLGGWQALPETDIFAMEYWELEQAKLKKRPATLPLQGRIALVTGAASGIGHACVKMLQAQGAAVAALDMNPSITTLFNQPEILGIVTDVTVEQDIQAAVKTCIRHFGGLDILVSNAGTFPASETIADISAGTWDASLAVNLTSHQRLLQACIPYLAIGIEATAIIIASKNVIAPGPGVSAYSVAKAGLTQLARVAALELGSLGIRVNVIHPNAVFDTAIWTPEVLEKRAKHYDMTIEEYKTNNILKTEVTTKDVAKLVCTMAGPIFAKITGVQVPIDGGNDRVI